VVALAALTPLVTEYVAWTAWSMRPAVLVSIINEIALKKRQRVVELGSGTSTIILARALQRSGGTLLSIEHDEEWAVYIAGLIRAEGLGDVATVERVDLAPYTEAHPAEASDWKVPDEWYQSSVLRSVVPSDVDLLVVDGPPAGRQEDVLVRHPAVPVLGDRLAKDFTLLLDDADRPAERETVARWEIELRVEFAIVERLSLAVARSTGGLIPYL
jgi:hypothetical protein